DHHHPVVLAQHFVVEVDADHAVGAELACRGDHVVERGVARTGQRALVAARPAADDVANRREHVAEDVGADDRLAVDHAEVLFDACGAAVGNHGGEEEAVGLLREPAHLRLLMRVAMAARYTGSLGARSGSWSLQPACSIVPDGFRGPRRSYWAS